MRLGFARPGPRHELRAITPLTLPGCALPPPSSLCALQPNYGWLTPVVGCIELMQCMVQAVPLAAKKTAHVGRTAESQAALLQLPHVDGEVLRKLARKKIRSLPGAPPWARSFGGGGGHVRQAAVGAPGSGVPAQLPAAHTQPVAGAALPPVRRRAAAAAAGRAGGGAAGRGAEQQRDGGRGDDAVGWVGWGWDTAGLWAAVLELAAPAPQLQLHGATCLMRAVACTHAAPRVAHLTPRCPCSCAPWWRSHAHGVGVGAVRGGGGGGG